MCNKLLQLQNEWRKSQTNKFNQTVQRHCSKINAHHDMIERYAAWGICFSDYLIFFNNHQKKKRVCMPDWLKRLLMLFLNSVSWSNRYEPRVLTIRQLRLKKPWCISHCTVNGNSRRLLRSAAITYGTALTEITRQSHFWCLNLKSQSLRISRSQHWLWQTDASRCCDYTKKPWFTKTVPWNHVWHPQTKSQCLINPNIPRAALLLFRRSVLWY